MTKWLRLIVAGAAMVVAAELQAQTPQSYGLIGKVSAKSGQRDALITLILEGSHAMAGCISYVVAKDAEDPNGIWVTEVWDSKASHDASLKRLAVNAAIRKAIPLIDMTAKGDQHATIPVGGIGLR